MATSCWFAVMLAVICPSVSMPLEAATPWSAATLELRIVPSGMSEEGNGTCGLQDALNTIAANQRENANETRDVKQLLVEMGETGLEQVKEAVVNVVRILASNQQQNAEQMRELTEEMREVKRLLESGSLQTNEARLEELASEIKDKIADEIRDVKSMMAYEYETRRLEKVIEAINDPSKQALLTALVFDCTPLLIQQHFKRSDSFNRPWAEYKVGFGDPSDNYWLGNDLLSQLTASDRYKLRFDLQQSDSGNWYYAEYSTFRVLTEADNYTLEVDGYSGNAGIDGLGLTQNGTMFTTYDRDNDVWSGGNCATYYGGGFWHSYCGYCQVNDRDQFLWRGLPPGGLSDYYLQTSRMWMECK